jgi:peptidoglycan L-alanyl-D-glutamate endopeptidase CwlK
MTATDRTWIAAVIITGLLAGYLAWDHLKAYFMGETWDYWTNKRIQDLHPSIRERATAFINEAEAKGINLRLTDGYRTFEQQAELYAKGRTKPGGIVTNAQPGESYHNYGLALDVVPIQDGQPQYDTEKWPTIAEIGKKYGFKWGGDFKSLDDKPHFYDPHGLDTDQLAARRQNGATRDGYIKLT